MTETNDVYILSGVRTAIGAFGESLAGVPPTELASLVIREALVRAQVEGGDTDHVVFGNVIHTEPKDMYLARVGAVNAGIPVEVPALTLNRLCGTGLQAIISAAQLIKLGDASIAVAGGAECMSRTPFTLPEMRWGRRLGDGKAVDMLVSALTDPFGNGHMGVTAENVAADTGISRETQDAFALESHRRATAAIGDGRFVDQILPVTVRAGRQTKQFGQDEHVRPDTTLEGLAKLRPVFKEQGTVTAGNASGINDGAAAVVLASGAEAERRGSTPLGRLVSYGHAGVDPSRMGLGPIPAVRRALERAGLSVDDMDVIESNEAFASQACAVAQTLKFPQERTNPNGGAIALGHPIGATGAILMVKALYELARIGGRYALITMCIGGGQGIAAVVERV